MNQLQEAEQRDQAIRARDLRRANRFRGLGFLCVGTGVLTVAVGNHAIADQPWLVLVLLALCLAGVLLYACSFRIRADYGADVSEYGGPVPPPKRNPEDWTS